MKTLYLECNMGAAGDMLMAALLELHPDKEDFLKRINKAGIPDVTITARKTEKCGILGTHMKVDIAGQEEACESVHGHEHESPHEHEGIHEHESPHEHEGTHAHEHHHNHEHDHLHPHVHMGMQDILAIVEELALPEKIKTDIKNIYQLIARAESKVHGKEVTEIHFHEVGMMDAIADITGCVMLMHELGVERVITSPVNVGFGQVRCAHGILPVPAPATALLLEGIPCYAGQIEGELCTPTGAAVLKYFTDEFSEMPQMAIQKIGYGMGKKDFAAANCIRAMLGETEENGNQITELCCNLDDMTPEEIGFASELLLENGALDAYTTAIGMKKGRPGILLTVMCRLEDKDKMAGLLFKHTTTIGIRETVHNRMILERREYEKQTEAGNIRMKECTGFGIKKVKPEYEDLKKIAKETGMSLREIKEKI
ncbi:MAG: nickel pincer cofactor biosynthesis protein LarC [Lachnospiraceae bacterium]|nr:nickel pincer cofactor biosynthesis protein LarC [Lachnospiraceae bacterium]